MYIWNVSMFKLNLYTPLHFVRRAGIYLWQLVCKIIGNEIRQAVKKLFQPRNCFLKGNLPLGLLRRKRQYSQAGRFYCWGHEKKSQTEWLEILAEIHETVIFRYQKSEATRSFRFYVQIKRPFAFSTSWARIINYNFRLCAPLILVTKFLSLSLTTKIILGQIYLLL